MCNRLIVDIRQKFACIPDGGQNVNENLTLYLFQSTLNNVVDCHNGSLVISLINNISIGRVEYFLYTLMHFKCICYFPFDFFFQLE